MARQQAASTARSGSARLPGPSPRPLRRWWRGPAAHPTSTEGGDPSSSYLSPACTAGSSGVRCRRRRRALQAAACTADAWCSAPHHASAARKSFFLSIFWILLVQFS